MYLTPIILQHLDILRQLQHLGIVFVQMISLNKGAVHKDWDYPETLGSFDKYNGLWPLWGMWKVNI